MPDPGIGLNCQNVVFSDQTFDEHNLTTMAPTHRVILRPREGSVPREKNLCGFKKPGAKRYNLPKQMTSAHDLHGHLSI